MEHATKNASKQIEYYKQIAEQTGNLYLRETETLSNIISRLKQAEASLKESEGKLRNIIEHSNELFYLHDTDHNLVYVSPKSVDFFGYTQEEARVKWMQMMTDHPMNQKGWEITQKAIQTGEKQNPYMLEGRKKDGGTILLEIEESPIKDEYGNVTFIAGAARDVTAAVKAQEEKEKLEARLRQSQKIEALGTMAGGIAHDFNNILSIILGNAEMAIRDTHELHPARESLDEVHRACLRAKDVIRQILSFSRMSEIELKPLDIRATIEESLKLIRSSLKSNIAIRSSFDDGIWPILGDATQINQILLNLCTNAADAIDDAGGEVSVTLENMESAGKDSELGLDPGRYVRMSISDTGIGISEADIPQIFDPFYTTKEVGKGTGMGLAVVHGIVETHGGQIKVSSTPGQGTVFEIFLSAVDAVPETYVPENEILPHGKEAIIFIDDEQSIAKLSKAGLEELGYQVVATTRPEEALEMFRYKSHQFDLVITDMTMPKMMGDELAKEIMKIRPEIPIILCTGFSERISEQQALENGFRAFVMKPFTLKEMAEKIRAVLDAGSV